jgi:hypothetical protein
LIALIDVGTLPKKQHPTPDPKVEKGAQTSIRSLLRALHSRNYRLFVAGHGISLVGTSTSFALSMVSLVVTGFGAMTLVASSNTIIQTIVD